MIFSSSGRKGDIIQWTRESPTCSCRAFVETASIFAETANGAKAIISRRLYELRELNLETLPIGEIVTVEKLLLIEIGKQNRFDEKQFDLDSPETYQAYKKDFPCKKFKPLI